MNTDNAVKQTFLLNDNTFAIEGLKNRFTEAEISAAESGEVNSYSEALNELLQKRQEIQMMDISQLLFE